jgi:hypothetical protein
MSKTIELNESIYQLLIEKNFNHFTITTLRNTLQALNDNYKNVGDDEARRFVYRQVVRLVNKGLLTRDKHLSPKRAQYSKTVLFKTSVFTKAGKCSVSSVSKFRKMKSNFKRELNDDIKAYESEIYILASEIEEYKRLISTYPNNIDSITIFLNKGQTRLLSLKGKLAALNNIKNIK